MYFLGGERKFIKAGNIESSIHDQVNECIHELLNCCSSEEIYKLNFFVSTSGYDDYQGVQSYILEKINHSFGKEFLVNVIAQAPLTRKVILEVFTYKPGEWKTSVITHLSGKVIRFSKNGTVFLMGSVQANGNHTCREQSEICFSSISEMLSSAGFSTENIIRQWNYIQDIIRFDGDNQNYQDFNDVRTRYYGNAFHGNGYPAATGIGMNEGGVIIEFIAMQSNEAITFAIDNPEQNAAHRYSDNVLVGTACGKTTPKFERARFLKYQNRQMMFISGTASILGEKTIGVGNPIEQTRITIANIRRLYSETILKQKNIEFGTILFNHCRVYIRQESDFTSIEKTCKELFGSIPMVFIQASICRDQLLVEIEGEVIL